MNTSSTLIISLYICSLVIYLIELLDEILSDKPKVLSEWLWCILLFAGAFVPVLNTVVVIKIIKEEK